MKQKNRENNELETTARRRRAALLDLADDFAQIALRLGRLAVETDDPGEDDAATDRHWRKTGPGRPMALTMEVSELLASVTVNLGKLADAAFVDREQETRHRRAKKLFTELRADLASAAVGVSFLANELDRDADGGTAAIAAQAADDVATATTDAPTGVATSGDAAAATSGNSGDAAAATSGDSGDAAAATSGNSGDAAAATSGDATERLGFFRLADGKTAWIVTNGEQTRVYTTAREIGHEHKTLKQAIAHLEAHGFEISLGETAACMRIPLTK